MDVLNTGTVPMRRGRGIRATSFVFIRVYLTPAETTPKEKMDPVFRLNSHRLVCQNVFLHGLSFTIDTIMFAISPIWI